METKNPEGRPTVMTPETVQILEAAFSEGASDVEACFLANISKQTLYSYQEKHPEFVDRKEALKEMVKFQAKKVIKKAIDRGDIDTAKWYAERKIKEEFSTRNELTGKNGEDLKTQPILVKFMDCGEPKDNRDTTGV
jgi:hypothetical protein